MKLLRNNPYVVTLYDVFETDRNYYIVMEKVVGMDLYDTLAAAEEGLSFIECREIVRHRTAACRLHCAVLHCSYDKAIS